ncbi:MAG TPA: ATP-binding cassette domain-containing protein, partial [Sphingomicrobium sp.]|nr:ATP-binding cassette domain-containing protein [Sphingomicrobium sp.]
MIRLADIRKSYPTRLGPVPVLDGVDLVVQPAECVGILGRNGAGKSTLIRLISGAELPTAGKIHRGMSVSWPLAFGGAFQSSLTGLDNLRFICRIYGVDP